MNTEKRIIYFDCGNLTDEDLTHVGVYKITNKQNGHFYVGSSDRSFKERLKEHCRYFEQYVKNPTRRCSNPILWNAYKKYGLENFKFEILEILDGYTYFDILTQEEYYINFLHPEYNVCLFPSKGGKPNLGRKLSKEWKDKIGEKSKLYKHSEETLKKVTINNKENAIKLTFINIDTNEQINFSSWIEAKDFFNLKSSAPLQCGYKKHGKWKKWKIIKLTQQRKCIEILINNVWVHFNSYGECDKYFDMWRGYTSELVHKKEKILFLNKYQFKLT